MHSPPMIGNLVLPIPCFVKQLMNHINAEALSTFNGIGIVTESSFRRQNQHSGCPHTVISRVRHHLQINGCHLLCRGSLFCKALTCCSQKSFRKLPSGRVCWDSPQWLPDPGAALNPLICHPSDTLLQSLLLRVLIFLLLSF